MTLPARMPSTAAAVTRRGAGRPGTSAVVITTSNLVVASESFCCCCARSSSGQGPRVAALAGRLDAQIEPLCAEGADLLCYFGAHVVARGASAEAPRGRQRLQAGVRRRRGQGRWRA